MGVACHSFLRKKKDVYISQRNVQRKRGYRQSSSSLSNTTLEIQTIIGHRKQVETA